CRTRHARDNLARRLAPSNVGRSPPGAPPRHYAASAAFSLAGEGGADRRQRAPRARVVVPGERCPRPPENEVASLTRRPPLPAPPTGVPSRRRPGEPGWL